MKAFLLAAGLGTRLKPLTDSTPKCLIKVCGKPLLAWWITLFEKHGVDEVLINLHYLSESVKNFIYSYQTKVHFELFYEEKLLGSAGTLRENKNFVSNEKHFLICYADNLTNFNLSEFMKFHISRVNPFSMALFRTDRPSEKGIVLLDEENVVVEFEEKPKLPKSNLANAGLYISSPEVLELIPNNEVTDIGYQLLPSLLRRINGWESKDYLIDIGIAADLKKAELEWPTKIKGNQDEL